MTNKIDWQGFVFNPEAGWIGRLERLARRRFPPSILADEAFNFALERLSADEWAILCKYTGKSKPGTFLTAVFNNLLEDFSRSRFGRRRPPVWLERMGTLWKRIYQFLCLERLDPPVIVDRLTQACERQAQEIHTAISVIRGRITDCGETVGNPVSLDTVTSADESGYGQGDHHTPHNDMERHDFAMLLSVIGELISGATQSPLTSNPVSADRLERWQAMGEQIEISDDERLVLRAIYQDGLSVAAASRALSVPEHQVRRSAQRSIARIREVFESAGLSGDVVRGLLND